MGLVEVPGGLVEIERVSGDGVELLAVESRRRQQLLAGEVLVEQRDRRSLVTRLHQVQRIGARVRQIEEHQQHGGQQA